MEPWKQETLDKIYESIRREKEAVEGLAAALGSSIDPAPFSCISDKSMKYARVRVRQFATIARIGQWPVIAALLRVRAACLLCRIILRLNAVDAWNTLAKYEQSER